MSAVESSSLRLRDVAANDDSGLSTVAELHMELLGFGPMSGLGETFVREICYRNHVQSDLLWLAVAEVDGKVAGLVAATPYSSTFHRHGLRHYFFSTAWHTLAAVVTSPKRLGALFRALRVLGSRRGEIQVIEASVGEVVCVAVRPEFLTRDVTQKIGGRLSQLLIQFSARTLRRCGVQTMRMLVDADNRAALMLYHLMGASFEDVSIGGEPMMQVSFDLQQFADDAELPPAWRDDSAADAEDQGGWVDYWNTVSGKPRVFAAEAIDYAERLRSLVGVTETDRVLDFGCGFGNTARQLANSVAQIDLWDNARGVRLQALKGTAGIANVGYADLGSDEDPLGTYDLICVHSVIQYMSQSEFESWLRRWRGMLKPGGRIVVSDILEKQGSPGREILRLAGFSMAKGFFLNMFVNGVREFGRYSKTRGARELRTQPRELLVRASREAGLRADILPHNLSYRDERYAAVLVAD